MWNKKKSDQNERMPFKTVCLWKTRDISMAAARLIVTGQLMLYATSILEMSPILVGTLVFVSKIFDGITDIFAGWLVDNTRTRFGRARPYEFAIIGMWASALMLFSCPTGFSLVAKSAWIFIAYTLVFSIFQTLLSANGTLYQIRAFGNKQKLVKLNAYGGIISMVGIVMISALYPMMLKKVAVDAFGWSKFLFIFAVPMAVFGMLRFLFIKEKSEDVKEEKDEKITLKQILQMLKINKYAWIYAGILGLFEMVQGLDVMTLYFNFYVGDISKMAILKASSLILLPVMLFFPKWLKKKEASSGRMG